MLAFFIATSEKQGVAPHELKGNTPNDILKEFTAQKEWIFPPDPSMRLITDMLSFCTKSMPYYNTISISGYHIREAGSTAAQELAFTLADGFTYLDYGIKAGINIDEFAPRLSFFLILILISLKKLQSLEQQDVSGLKGLNLNIKLKTKILEASFSYSNCRM